MRVVALRAGSATDVGRVRSNNQDSYLTSDPLYAVADGMGGAAAGEVASAIAVEALNNGFHQSDGPPTPELLIASAQAANRAVWDEAEANPEMRGMGTTLVAIALVEGPELAIINIGDSRLYVLEDGELRQVTFDHNLVAEMVAEGRITPAEAEVHPRRNIMTRALGVEPEVPIDLFMEEPRPGDRYLLCSDGLPREVNDDLIASLLRRIADPQDAAKELVDEAKRRGGNDNITVVVVDVVGDDDPRAAAAAPTDADAAAGDATTALSATDAGAVAAGAGPPLADETTTLPAAPVDDPEEAPAEPAAGGRRSFFRRRPGPRTRSALTVRVVAFVVLLLVILGGAAAAIVWYARSSYFVGLRGNQIVIYQGRPGGVLGLNPTLKQVTPYTTADVLQVAVPSLKSGQEESSVAAAQQYVHNLVTAYQTAQQAGGAPVTSATTTVPPVTTVPPGAPTTVRKP
ncbi:MAG TPA: Stp1/IreP family PP2C-type Ser/Thr phosphatase [Acidimicrobiales bacterium]|nr:Stp1/IreP family PP2C-type Ser/Thr phosphatase [Acidimicrobiales bacterium]